MNPRCPAEQLANRYTPFQCCSGVEDGRGYFLGCVAERQGGGPGARGNCHNLKPLAHLSSPLSQVVRLPWRSGTPPHTVTRHPGGQGLGVFTDDLERGRKTGPVYAHCQCTQQTKAGLKRRLLGESEKATRRSPDPTPERPTGRNRLFRVRSHWQNQSPFQILLRVVFCVWLIGYWTFRFRLYIQLLPRC